MSQFNDLNDINSFTHFTDNDITGIERDVLFLMLKKMIIIRKAEELLNVPHILELDKKLLQLLLLYA